MSTPGNKRRSWVVLLSPALLAFVVLIGLGTILPIKSLRSSLVLGGTRTAGGDGSRS